MAPPESEKCPVVLYNLGGVIFNILLTVVLMSLYFVVPYVAIVSELFIISATFSFIIALTNGIPMAPGGMPNDGMNAFYLSGNGSAEIAFRNQLLMNDELARGELLTDMPDEWFKLPEDADMQNVHCASIAVFAANRIMYSMDFAAAEVESIKLLKSNYNISSIHRNLIACDVIFCRLVADGGKAEISSLLTINQQKFMQSMKSFPSVLRTEYAIALIRDKNTEKADKIRQKFEKIIKSYPYPQDAAQELAYVEYAARRASELALKETENA